MNTRGGGKKSGEAERPPCGADLCRVVSWRGLCFGTGAVAVFRLLRPRGTGRDRRGDGIACALRPCADVHRFTHRRSGDGPCARAVGEAHMAAAYLLRPAAPAALRRRGHYVRGGRSAALPALFAAGSARQRGDGGARDACGAARSARYGGRFYAHRSYHRGADGPLCGAGARALWAARSAARSGRGREQSAHAKRVLRRGDLLLL